MKEPAMSVEADFNPDKHFYLARSIESIELRRIILDVKSIAFQS